MKPMVRPITKPKTKQETMEKRYDTNASKITISLRKNEREAMKREAEAEGLKLPTWCAEVIRRHLSREAEEGENRKKPV